VANIFWSYGELKREPGAEARAALEAAVVRVALGMNEQGVANTVFAYARLRLMPGAEARAALEAAVVRVALGMNEQGVASTVLAHATLGLTPGAEAQAALEAAVVRVGPSMDPQAVTNTLWAFLTLAATRSLPLPACYPSLWRAVCGLDAGSLQDVGLRILFHAYLVHTELVGGDVRDEVTIPPWIMLEAQEAWMRQVREDVSVSGSHKAFASIIADLGIRCEVERLSDDDHFSVDVFLPDDDVAIEFDGPSHFFINTSDGGEGGAPGDASRTTRTPSTELRDMFLWRRYRTVLSVPHFEWDEQRGSAARRAYVAAKLRAVGVSVPAST